MPNIRVLNPEGLSTFKEFVGQLRQNPSLEPPLFMLEDGRFSDPFEHALSISNSTFENRFAFGEYLVNLFNPIEARLISRNHSLWSWMALYFFDFLCPADADGRRHPLQDDLYVLQPDFSFRRKRPANPFLNLTV